MLRLRGTDGQPTTRLLSTLANRRRGYLYSTEKIPILMRRESHESKGGDVWREIMTHATGYLKHGSSKSFELPTFNAIRKKEETRTVLEENKLNHECSIFLCQTGVQGTDGNLVGKSLKFCSTSFSFGKHLHGRFGRCRCQVHSGMSSISYHQTGFYTKKLAKVSKEV